MSTGDLDRRCAKPLEMLPPHLSLQASDLVSSFCRQPTQSRVQSLTHPNCMRHDDFHDKTTSETYNYSSCPSLGLYL